MNSNLSYSPETPNLGQIRRFLEPCDLEIWLMTLQNNRAPLLSNIKLYASFHHHMWIQTGVTVRKRLSWVVTSAGCPAHRSARKIGKKDFFTRKNRRKTGKYYRKQGGKQEHNSTIWNSKLLSYDGLPFPLQLSQSPPFYLKKITTKNREKSILTAYKISMYQTPVTRITCSGCYQAVHDFESIMNQSIFFFVQHSTTEWLHYELSKVCYTMIIYIFFITNSTRWLIFATKRTGLQIHNHIFTLKWSHCNQSLLFPVFSFFYNRR